MDTKMFTFITKDPETGIVEDWWAVGAKLKDFSLEEALEMFKTDDQTKGLEAILVYEGSHRAVHRVKREAQIAPSS